jgi:hypothetical protein
VDEATLSVIRRHGGFPILDGCRSPVAEAKLSVIRGHRDSRGVPRQPVFPECHPDREGGTWGQGRYAADATCPSRSLPFGRVAVIVYGGRTQEVASFAPAASFRAGVPWQPATGNPNQKDTRTSGRSASGTGNRQPQVEGHANIRRECLVHRPPATGNPNRKDTRTSGRSASATGHRQPESKDTRPSGGSASSTVHRPPSTATRFRSTAGCPTAPPAPVRSRRRSLRRLRRRGSRRRGRGCAGRGGRAGPRA